MKRSNKTSLGTVFTEPVTVNTIGPPVIIWTQHGRLEMSLAKARIFVKLLIDAGVSVYAYWADCTERERKLDPRVLTLQDDVCSTKFRS